MYVFPESLAAHLSDQYNDVVYFEPDFPTSGEEDASKFNLVVCGRKCNFSPKKMVQVCYIGEEGVTLNNLMLTLNRYIFYSYSPKNLCLRKETLDVNQALRKRYYLMEKVKDAKLIGILIATLGNLKIHSHVWYQCTNFFEYFSTRRRRLLGNYRKIKDADYKSSQKVGPIIFKLLCL